MNSRRSRREFLQVVAGAATAAPTLLHAQRSTSSRTVAPNDRIRVGIIGVGIRGQQDLRSALHAPGVELTAAADVYDGRLALAKELWGNAVFTTRDYRELLARPDVDAVIIAAPDHWHMQMAVDAMQAGKHVYVEKPMVQALEDGPRIIEAARQTGRVLQVGSQHVSSIVYAKARELFRAGAIGELNLVEAWINRNSSLGAWQYSVPPDASTATIDWDRFLGRAPKRPFDPVRLFRWRNYRDYGTGIPGDLFVHLFTGIHFVLDAIGPTRAIASGGLRHWNDGRDVPDVMLALYDYPKTPTHPAFTLSLKVNFAEGAGNAYVFRFVGAEGVLTIGDNAVTLSRLQPVKEPGHRATPSEGHTGSLHERVSGEIFRSARAPAAQRRDVCGAAAVQQCRRPLLNTSSTRCGRGDRWSKMRCSACAPPVRRCSRTTATSKIGRSAGTPRR